MNDSYWIESTKNLSPKFGELTEDIETDVCIIGAGITGISTAYELALNGLNVVVLDRRNDICTHTTGNTTAKITSGHDLFYKYLINSFSEKIAKQYLYANEEAISNIKTIASRENIDCDFETKDNYIFTGSLEEIPKLQDEAAAINSLGIEAEFVTECSLPLEILGAVKLKNQAQFHPRKYALGLCNAILKNNGQIYIGAKVCDVKHEKNQYITYTENNKITSKYVVLASHYPIINAPGFYFLKMYQERSYIIGVETNFNLFDGMYISSEQPTLSFRTAKYNGKELVLVGGSNHKVADNKNVENSYDFLEESVKKIYPDANLLYRWSAQDCISLDKIPYIGEFSTTNPHMYVATGFKKWGMTTSNVAANIIKDKILGKKNNYEEAFLSTRFQPVKNHEETAAMLKQTAKSLILDKLVLPEETITDLEDNEGKIIELDGRKIGVYKSGKDIYTINPVCAHLGCELEFNNLDKTWDCPCHGSRFRYTGECMNEPSIKDL